MFPAPRGRVAPELSTSRPSGTSAGRVAAALLASVLLACAAPLRDTSSDRAATRATEGVALERELRAWVHARGPAGLARGARMRVATTAPPKPKVRRIPRSIFDVTTKRIGGQRRVIRSLDADRDGKPEVVRIEAPVSGELIELGLDTDYDGDLDTWQDYRGGKLWRHRQDRDRDGRVDRIESFADDTCYEVESDHDGDGRMEARELYLRGVLISERYDANLDGNPEYRADYLEGVRVRQLLDRNSDGAVDLWIDYDPTGLPARLGTSAAPRTTRPDVWRDFVEPPAAAPCEDECSDWVRDFDRRLVRALDRTRVRPGSVSIRFRVDEAGLIYRLEGGGAEVSRRNLDEVERAIARIRPFPIPPRSAVHRWLRTNLTAEAPAPRQRR